MVITMSPYLSFNYISAEIKTPILHSLRHTIFIISQKLWSTSEISSGCTVLGDPMFKHFTSVKGEFKGGGLQVFDC
jgi:hypothetical protein